MSIAKTSSFGTGCVCNIFVSEWTSRSNKIPKYRGKGVLVSFGRYINYTVFGYE